MMVWWRSWSLVKKKVVVLVMDFMERVVVEEEE